MNLMTYKIYYLAFIARSLKSGKFSDDRGLCAFWFHGKGTSNILFCLINLKSKKTGTNLSRGHSTTLKWEGFRSK